MSVKLRHDKKLRYLGEYMIEYINAMPNKIKPFDSWLNSVLDKKINKGERKAKKAYFSRCRYCTAKFVEDDLNKTKDHVIPVSKGGLDRKENRRPCCYDCNQWKADKMPQDWCDELSKIVRSGKSNKPNYSISTIGLMIGNLRTVIVEIKKQKKRVSIYNF